MGSPDDELLQVMSHASWFLNDGVLFCTLDSLLSRMAFQTHIQDIHPIVILPISGKHPETSIKWLLLQVAYHAGFDADRRHPGLAPKRGMGLQTQLLSLFGIGLCSLLISYRLMKKRWLM